MELQSVLERLRAVWTEASGLWLSGGWAMLGIAAIALVMFALGVSVWVRLRAKGFLSVPEDTWREWIDHPDQREGPIGELLEQATSGRTLEEVATIFAELRASESAPFERDLRVMHVCVSAAPLVGLLGTVTGMLATFGALASGAGGEKTMGMVAEGISVALITTETGLVVALPGLFFQYQLARKHERYKAFLAHLETVCTQTLHRFQRADEDRAVQRAALAQVRALLAARLRRPRPSAPLGGEPDGSTEAPRAPEARGEGHARVHALGAR